MPDSMPAAAPAEIFPLRGALIYVSGHRGMVGSACVRRLTAEGAEVITADRATVLATAGLALREIAHILRVVHTDSGPAAPPPATVDTTLEFDLSSGTVTARRWSPHPDCSC